MMNFNAKTLFHVHTFRCGHAEQIPDEAYVQKAVEIGASDIWFTDHAPFPGNPFGGRMAFECLHNYIRELSALKDDYSDRVRVHVGLETEYFPSFDKSGYYRQLLQIPGLEILLLGQHMAEISEDPPFYSFSLPEERLDHEEFRALGNAMVSGIRSGYFAAVAHPDRIFRRCTKWTDETQRTADEIIQAAATEEIPLELNQASLRESGYYRPEFWISARKHKAAVIQGIDAHSLGELEFPRTIAF